MRTFRNRKGVLIRVLGRNIDPSGVLTRPRLTHHSNQYLASVARNLRESVVQHQGEETIVAAQEDMMRKFGLLKSSSNSR